MGMARLANPAPMTQREIDALVLCAEHCGIPYDLLAGLLDVPAARVRRIVGRWCDLGWAAAGRLGDGPDWCLGSAVNRRPGLRPDKNGLVGGFPASQNLEMS